MQTAMDSVTEISPLRRCSLQQHRFVDRPLQKTISVWRNLDPWPLIIFAAPLAQGAPPKCSLRSPGLIHDLMLENLSKWAPSCLKFRFRQVFQLIVARCHLVSALPGSAAPELRPANSQSRKLLLISRGGAAGPRERRSPPSPEHDRVLGSGRERPRRPERRRLRRRRVGSRAFRAPDRSDQAESSLCCWTAGQRHQSEKSSATDGSSSRRSPPLLPRPAEPAALRSCGSRRKQARKQRARECRGS